MGPVGNSSRLRGGPQVHHPPEDLNDKPEGDEEQGRYPGDAAERRQEEKNANRACGQIKSSFNRSLSLREGPLLESSKPT